MTQGESVVLLPFEAQENDSLSQLAMMHSLQVQHPVHRDNNESTDHPYRSLHDPKEKDRHSISRVRRECLT